MESKGKADEVPLLLISDAYVFDRHGLYNVSENLFRIPKIPTLSHKSVAASTHGWVVLFDTINNGGRLWNPISWDTIQLPPLEDWSLYDSCILTKPPTEPDCHIIFNQRTGGKQAHWTIDEEAFVTQTSNTLLAMGSFEGRIYGIVGGNYALASIDFVGKSLELRRIFELGNLDKLSRPLRPYRLSDDYLVEGDGVLFLVRKLVPVLKSVDGYEFRVFAVYPDKMECVEVEDIGEGTIFVDGNSGGFCCVDASLKSNSIYYTRGKNCSVYYVYNLDDGTTVSMLPSAAVDELSSCTSCWVQRAPFLNLLSKF